MKKLSDGVLYLQEKGAISEQTATVWLDSHCVTYHDYKKLIEYFLENDFTTKPDYVARNIEYDQLIERMNSKFKFTFDEIYDACDQFIYSNENGLNHFYVNVHKHFPDPDFQDPFKDPFDDYKKHMICPL